MSNLNKEFKRAKYRKLVNDATKLEDLREMALLLLKQNALLEDMIEAEFKKQLRIED